MFQFPSCPESLNFPRLHIIFAVKIVLYLVLVQPMMLKGQSAEQNRWFNGSIHATNNGISLIPTFMLGKPASIFYLSVGSAKFRFEPEMRFSLKGQPWSFIFWWRYQLLERDRFKLSLGAHPSLAFRATTADLNGRPTEVLYPTRFFAGELVPTWKILDHVSVGMYYLYSRGLDSYANRNTHFLTVNTHFSKIKLSGGYYLNWKPQLYYLKIDQKDGVFFVSNLTLAKEKAPFSIYAIVNKRLRSTIVSSRDFVWNLSCAYSFQNHYLKKGRNR